MLRRSSLHIGRNIAGSVGSYLPEMITEMWEPARDFAFLKLPNSGVRSLVAFRCRDHGVKMIILPTMINPGSMYLCSTTPQVMVATSDGFFYQYNIDLENGGECVLLKQYRWVYEWDNMEHWTDKMTLPTLACWSRPMGWMDQVSMTNKIHPTTLRSLGSFFPLARFVLTV